MDPKDGLLDDLASPEQIAAANGPVDTIVPALDEAELDAEIANQAKYGNSPVRTAVESALSAATLGASNQLLGQTALARQGLKQRQDLNPVASGIGEVGGIIASSLIEAPLLPANMAVKAGKVAEDITSRAIAQRLKSKAAREVLSKVTGGAAEGGIYSLGNLNSEQALGNAEFNGENIVGSAGAGALLGGGFGGVLGAVNATVPLASKTFGKLNKKLVENSESLLDDVAAAKEMSGLSLTKRYKIEQKDPEFFKELPQYYREKLNLNVWTDPTERAAANKVVLENAGRELGKIHKQLDEIVATNPAVTPSRAQMYQPLLDKIEAEGKLLSISENANASKISVLQDLKDDILKHAVKDRPFNYREFDDLRKSYQSMKWSKTGIEAQDFKANVAGALRAEARKSVDAMAARISAAYKGTPVETLAADLKAFNRDYHIASTLDEPFSKRADKKAGLSHMDTIEAWAAINIAGGPLGGAAFLAKKLTNTDLRRNAVILWDIKRQYEATKKLALESIDSFFKGTKKPARAASLRALVSSGFSLDENKKAPKNSNEAFKNVSKNLIALKTDPEFLTERLAKTTARISTAAPAASGAAQQALVRAVDFLDAKLPRPVTSGSDGLFKKEFIPSSLQLAKFERYLQVVEHPFSILTDLEKGTITREHVEALKTVYPTLYTELQTGILDKVTKEGNKLSYGKKLQLGILLDIPTDESLEPINIAGLQANFAAQAQTEQGGQATTGVSSTATKNLNFADRAASGTQKVAGRE